MKKAGRVWLVLFTLLVATSLSSLNLGVADPEQARIYIYDPETQTSTSSVAPGETFTVEVKVAGVAQLWDWQFYLSWNGSVLEFVRMAEGPFLNSSGVYTSFFVPQHPPPGYGENTIAMIDALYGVGSSGAPSGGGVLGTVTFRVKASGATSLTLFKTKLEQYDPFTPKPIVHTLEHGYFAYPLPKVSVEPVEIIDPGLQAPSTFNINITVDSVDNLYNWTLWVSWTPTVLELDSVAEGSFLKDEGTTSFAAPQIDQAAGTLFVANTLTGEPLGGVNGTGVLAALTFRVETRGISPINIYDVKLFDNDGESILLALSDGFFSNVVRNVAVTSVQVSSTSVVKGQSVTVTVVVENLGDMTETFFVTVYYGDTAVYEETVSGLAPGDSDIITFTWDTKDVPDGSYVIKAVASNVPSESNASDNQKTAASNFTVTGNQSGIPLMMIIGIVGGIAVVAVVGGLFFLRRRSRG